MSGTAGSGEVRQGKARVCNMTHIKDRAGYGPVWFGCPGLGDVGFGRVWRGAARQGLVRINNETEK